MKKNINHIRIDFFIQRISVSKKESNIFLLTKNDPFLSLEFLTSITTETVGDTHVWSPYPDSNRTLPGTTPCSGITGDNQRAQHPRFHASAGANARRLGGFRRWLS